MFRLTSLIFIALLFPWNGRVRAQAFHTVTGNTPRYKVEQPVTTKQREASPSDTSQDNASAAASALLPDTIKAERTGYPLQTAYPLRQSKLVITSPYGWRKHPVTGKRSFHAGVDLRANYEPVYSMLHGEVVNTGFEPKGRNFITLRHGNIQVTYCHLSLISVKKGSPVYAGQPIGLSGNSGKSTTGPHLHLGIRTFDGPFLDANVFLEAIKFHFFIDSDSCSGLY